MILFLFCSVGDITGFEVYVQSMHSPHVVEETITGDVYHSKPKKGSRTFLCAVDGSEGSNVAFHMMMSMRKHFDRVCVFHTYSLDKEETLPPHFRKDELRSYYENEFIHTYQIPMGKFSFDWVDRKGKSVNEILVDLLEEYKGIRNPMTPTRQAPDFFFCGFSGRKKSSSFEGKDCIIDTSNLGSTANFASRNITVPVIISKKPLRSSDHPRCFVVGVDGTSLSKKGFHILLQLVKPEDIIKSVYIYCTVQSNLREDIDTSDPACQAIFEDYRSEIANLPLNVNATFETLICPDDDCSIPTIICEYAQDQNADFIVLSPRAVGDLSSISEQVIFLSPCSVILTKN